MNNGILSRDQQILAYAAVNAQEWHGFKTWKGLKHPDCTVPPEIVGMVAGFLFRAAELGEQIEARHAKMAREEIEMYPDGDRMLAAWYVGR